MGGNAVRAWRSHLALFLLAALLSACAAPTSYMGISYVPDAAARDLQDLARRAQAGDKQAQLDLGIAYEEGLGVAVDLKQAERLYRMAAATTGGTAVVYVPPFKKVGRGGVTLVSSGPSMLGLEEARTRLARMKP
jgi:hypothetical protein